MATDTERHELETHIGDALAVHGHWIDEVAQVATGIRSADTVDITLREDACAFGQWLNGPIASGLRNDPLFWLTKARHATFHRHASLILNAARRSDPTLKNMVGSATAFGENAKMLRSVLHDWMQKAYRHAS